MCSETARRRWIEAARGLPTIDDLVAMIPRHRASEPARAFAAEQFVVNRSQLLSFPVFANRLMPRDRADYGSYVEQLDLSVEADPFEVLGRSEGVRATDRIEVFPGAEVTPDGRLCTLFFARGIRHLEGASEAVDALLVGDELVLAPEPINPVNPRAMLLNTRTDTSVGWASDFQSLA